MRGYETDVGRLDAYFESASAFKLYRIAGEMLTDIPFTYEDGVISFQIDQAGLFLLAADGASFSLPSA